MIVLRVVIGESCTNGRCRECGCRYVGHRSARASGGRRGRGGAGAAPRDIYGEARVAAWPQPGVAGATAAAAAAHQPPAAHGQPAAAGAADGAANAAVSQPRQPGTLGPLRPPDPAVPHAAATRPGQHAAATGPGQHAAVPRAAAATTAPAAAHSSGAGGGGAPARTLPVTAPAIDWDDDDGDVMEAINASAGPWDHAVSCDSCLP